MTAVRLPLTVPEVRRLLLLTCLTGDEAARRFHLAWSHWRREHQARARRGHYRHRLARHDPRPPP